MRSLIMGLLLCVPLAAQEETKPQTPREQYQALLTEYKQAEDAWNKRFNVEAGQVDFEARYRDWPGWSFAPRFLMLAEANPEDKVEIEALLWVVGLGRQVAENDRLLLPHFERATELLIRDHLHDERVGRVCLELAGGPLSEPREKFVRTVMEKSREHQVRGRACLGLAEYLAAKRDIVLKPWFDVPQPPFQAFIVTRLDPHYFEYIRGADPQATFDEAERLFEKVVSEYGDIPYSQESRDAGLRQVLDNLLSRVRRRTLGKVAEKDLFALRNLSLGRVAPEIEGEDAEGKRFRLSDYRGKVVVLTFSGNWCGPCREMYPQERELVERLRGKPFALLSVNTDQDKETLRKSIESEEITWRCWWDGGREGPICSEWNVRSFPTVYVLDSEGVIRYKDVRDKTLDAAVDELLKAK